jgi:hypothetical protein
MTALRSRVLDADQFLEKSAKSARVRRLVSSKPTGEMRTREIPRSFAEILSVSTFGGGLWLR